MNPPSKTNLSTGAAELSSVILQQQDLHQQRQSIQEQRMSLQTINFFASLQKTCMAKQQRSDMDGMPNKNRVNALAGNVLGNSTVNKALMQHNGPRSADVIGMAHGEEMPTKQHNTHRISGSPAVTPPLRFRDNHNATAFQFYPANVASLMVQAGRTSMRNFPTGSWSYMQPQQSRHESLSDVEYKHSQSSLQSSPPIDHVSSIDVSRQKSVGKEGDQQRNKENIGLEKRYRSEPELKVDRFMTRCYEQASPSSTLFDDKGHFKVSQMDVLSEKIWSFHNSMTQTDTTLSRKLYLRDLLYYVICPIFPMCGLYVVGSSLNGFGNNTSDMDVCLMITNHDLDQKKDAIVVLNLVFTSLNKVEWIAEQQLIFAKVPILRIKFQAPYSDIIVDLNVNNSVAIRNTHLLSYYSNFDWRIRPLVTIVKEWAKRKGINDANQSSFTSYSLVLMVIHYLQCGVEPRLLPSLQRAFPKRFNGNNDVRSLNVTMMLPPIENWDYNDKITLGELLIGFLDYYANQFDYDTDAISIHDGVKIDRRAIVSQQLPRHGSSQAAIGSGSWRSQWRCICIEEPFTNLNTAHSIYDEMVFNEIKQAFRESHDELNGSSDHVMAVTASQKASNSTQNAAASGRSSATSGSSLMENDSERQPSPVSQLFEKAHTTRWNNANSPPSSKSNMNGNNQAGQKRNSYQQSGTYRSYRPNNNQGPRKSYNNRSYHNQQRNGAPTPNGPNC
ncbi:unnamed protein product, partial [Mesorhabditis belari]|uniref:polynucleotide adenylyltransferase n=1 Tax=Mesorhabditis belari TaxID=2138241 RepID=A0AAF3FAS5_9BILA